MEKLINIGDTKCWHYNACVGTNGIITNWLYFEGFAEATKYLCNIVLTQNRFLADSLIYPIIFNARHSIELAIKITFNSFLTINNDKNTNQLKGHNILWLFRKLKEYSKFNNQILESLNKIEDKIPNTIYQIIKIDTSGETFRYRTDNYKSNHLDGIVRLINIQTFYLDYSKFYELMDGFIGSLDYFLDCPDY